MDGEELTQQETELYDRQIRVWGVDAQRRLSKANVLVCGMTGTVAEFCKNIVLAGVGSVTLVDDGVVTEAALSANFLIPPDESVSKGRTLAELCCDSLVEFNSMVRVSVEKGDISSFGEDFFSKFDVVVISSCSLATKKLINEKCRRLLRRVAFYTVDCRDSCGEIFVDLQNYKYTKLALFSEFAISASGRVGNEHRYSFEKVDEAVEFELKYPSFEEAITTPWKRLPRRMVRLYFAMRVIEKFEEAEGRKPGETSILDFPGVMKKRQELCEEESFNESQIPDYLLERLVVGTREFPPVCAVIGGILGQEVIKAISGKGDPLKNFFFFDAFDGKGIIEDISNPDAAS